MDEMQATRIAVSTNAAGTLTALSAIALFAPVPLLPIFVHIMCGTGASADAMMDCMSTAYLYHIGGVIAGAFIAFGQLDWTPFDQ